MVFVKYILIFSNIFQLIENNIPDWSNIHCNRKKNKFKNFNANVLDLKVLIRKHLY